jgi:outer membrane lipoprotein carrier protein
MLLGSASALDERVPREAAELLAKLEAASQNVETLAGEFTQRNRVKLFKQELTSSGRLYFRKPRQIRWQYLAPDPSTLILDGSRAILSMPGAPPQAFDLDKDAAMRALFEQLLMWLSPAALARARDDYQLSLAGSAEAPRLTLVPRSQNPVVRTFSRIELRFDGRSALLRSILLVELGGDEKEISFARLERNAKLPPDAFK